MAPERWEAPKPRADERIDDHMRRVISSLEDYVAALMHRSATTPTAFIRDATDRALLEERTMAKARAVVETTDVHGYGIEVILRALFSAGMLIDPELHAPDDDG